MPKVHVRVQADGQDVTLAGLTVIEAAGSHDVAMVDVIYRQGSLSGSRPASLLWRDRLPVSVVHGRSASSTSTFYGYVVGHQVVPRDEQDRSQYQRVRYILQGTSFPMQSAKGVAWTDTTASAMARTIATSYGLVPVVTPHPRVFEYRAQVNTSDFRFLAERSEEVGYDFSVSGPYLYFRNPIDLLANASLSSVVPLTMNNGLTAPDTLLSFSPLVGETITDGGVVATREVPVLTASGSVLTAIAGTSDVSLRSRSRAASFAEAVQVAEAEQLANATWQTATARSVGDSRLHVGSVAAVDGAGVADEHAGLWSVREVSHEYTLDPLHLDQSTYYCDLDLRRDKQRKTKDIPVTRHIPTSSPVAMSVFDGVWRAHG